MCRLDTSLGVDIMSSGSQDKHPSPLSEHALRILIRVALERSYYREVVHAEDHHPERNISVDDVIYGLEREDWTLAKTPNYDTSHQSWEYLIKTVDIEGDELNLKIAAFPNEKRFEVITRW
jgi:hypothetical protein